MKAIVRKAFGGPEQLQLQEVPKPEPKPGEIVIRVRAFGLNRAEQYFREGTWGDVHAISGIECVGEVEEDGDGLLPRGQPVLAIMGGMGRTIAGSYAEFTRVPRSNVVAIEASIAWERLAAIPESYATAWSCLRGNLAIAPSQRLVIRGATSALGQAAINIAVHQAAHVIAITRNSSKDELLKSLGVESILREDGSLSRNVRDLYPSGVDAVLDLIGNTTILDSLRMTRPQGRVCLAGFLGGDEPIKDFQALVHMPSSVHFSFFASAFTLGSTAYPLADIPFDQFIAQTAAGHYKPGPAHVFEFQHIQQAHRLMDSNQALGKIVVLLSR